MMNAMHSVKVCFLSGLMFLPLMTCAVAADQQNICRIWLEEDAVLRIADAKTVALDDNKVAAVSVQDGMIIVTGKTEGAAELTVFDKDGKIIAKRKIEVAPYALPVIPPTMVASLTPAE